ncbi:MAG: phosphodiester glycosidase family protein [Oscillospiraceae bacterium]|nr:phosphodiester glycosidase family protein [Oscillospiraceae bacterium]
MKQSKRIHRRKYTALLKALLFICVTVFIMMITILRIVKTVRSKEYPAAQRELALSADNCAEAKIAKNWLPEQSASLSPAEQLPAPEPEHRELPLNAQTAPAAETTQQETEFIDISGQYYRGKIMLIKDPSRVYVGVSGPLGGNNVGKKIPDIIASYGAAGGTNASGFVDDMGKGNGGTPLGLVISEGSMKYGYAGGSYEVIGFDKNNKLHCAWMTGQQALNIGIRDSVCFGPILISNGKKAGNLKTVNYNPRTAIGQREDGTVILLILEGRQISSIGATLDNIADIMLEYGAVNAGNLDGGSSSVLYYKGEQLTTGSSLRGTRSVPTAILIKPESGQGGSDETE